jgi:hypothetical protein
MIESFFKHFKEKQTKVIFLERKNYFLTYLSAQIGRANGYTLLKENFNKNKLKKFIFDVDDFNKQFIKHINFIKYINFYIKKYELQIHNISYEELISTNSINHYKGIYNFLGIEDKDILNANNEDLKICKQNIYSLEEQIENIEEVKTILVDNFDFNIASNTFVL